MNGGAAPLNEWSVRIRFGSAADALFVQRNRIAALSRRPGRTARGALSRCHITVTLLPVAALPLRPSQRSLAAPPIHRDPPPTRDRFGSRESCECGSCVTRWESNEKHVVAVVSTFVLRKPAQRDSSRNDQIAMEFQPCWISRREAGAGHEQSMADKLPERPVSVHGTIVEI